MKLGVCVQSLYHLPFHEALASAAILGFEAVELPVDSRSPFIDLETALADRGRGLARAVREHGLVISALSNHQEGQLLFGPHGADSDGIFFGSPAEKMRFAVSRLKKSAELARWLEVDIVCGFTGCEDYSRWFPWPEPEAFEGMGPVFRERMLPLLDHFQSCGVVFAHECHPRQLAYNLETAQWALGLLEGHPAWAYNLDPANLLLAGMDPVVFAAELSSRIRHVHAKDGELVRHNAGRSGLLAHGPWERRGRGFRFRIPGWGDVEWRRLISELQLGGYTGVLAVEHEDPCLSQIEGLKLALQYLSPLIPREPPPRVRWW